NDLPEDGEAELFNKIGDVLDVSHVQMTRYMKAATQAMRHAMGVELMRMELPPATVKRYYARDHPNLTRTFYADRERQRPFKHSRRIRNRRRPRGAGAGRPARGGGE